MKKLLIIILIALCGCFILQAQSSLVNDKLAVKISAFWKYISKNESRICNVNSDTLALTDEITKQIRLIDENLYVFFGPIFDGKRDIVISCGGNVEYFDLCDRIVKVAPVSARIIPVSLMPPMKKPEDVDVYAIGGNMLDIREINVHFDDEEGELELLFLLTSNHLTSIRNDASGQIYGVYMHALYLLSLQVLGERIVGTRIKKADIPPLPLIMPSVPFVELGKYIH